MTEIKSISEFVSPPATPTGPFTKMSETGQSDSTGLRDSAALLDKGLRDGTGLREGDVRKLIALLSKGDDALARRKDLTELHKRIVTMFATLNQGLVETQEAKARDDRTELVQRLDQVERAVNGMEGALRIELEPMMRNIVRAEIDRTGKNQGKNPMRAVWIAIGLAGAIALGAYYGEEISAFAKQMLPAVGLGIVENVSTSSPIGGISVAPNRIM